MSGSTGGGPGRCGCVRVDEAGKADTTGEVGLTPRRGTITVRSARSLGASRVEVGAGGGSTVLILGLVLLIIGYLTNLGILVTLGIILLVIGAVLWILGSMGRPVGGRRHYW
jgi:hypothetical protein